MARQRSKARNAAATCLHTAVLLLLAARAASQDCGARFPWVEPALDKWYTLATQSAIESTMTSEQGLQAIRELMWGDYMPGKEEIILQHDMQTNRVVMHVQRVSKPNQEHKPPGMITLIRRAVEKHNAELAAKLQGRELRFIMQTEDFPIIRREWKWKLPAFSMCQEDESTDIPVPDFTFEAYPETHYKNSSWWSVKQLLGFKGYMIGWQERARRIFMRHFSGVGPRKHIMPKFIEMQKAGTDVQQLGVASDVQDTGFVTSRMDTFMWLDHWCNYRYLIHTAGFSYSAGLKYKLACGSMVFKFKAKYSEFFEPGLKPGIHYVELEEAEDVFHGQSVPKIKEAIRKAESQYHEHPPQMAIEGRNFAMHQLTKDSLSCYWAKAMIRYADLYFM